MLVVWKRSDEREADEASRRNEQVGKLIQALGASGSAGRRAILVAVAQKQGITAEEDIDALMNGESEVKLQVPASLRSTLSEVGLGRLLAPINVLTIAEDPQQILLNETWKDIEFEVALDSGSVVHVCAPVDVPGYDRGVARKQAGPELPDGGRRRDPEYGTEQP